MLALSCEADPPANRLPPLTGSGGNETVRPCLELQVPRDGVRLGEPLSLIASLVNCTSTTQEVQDLLSPDLGFLQVWIRPPDGREFLHRPLASREARGKPTRSLAPGERISAFVPVYFGPDGWTMSRPGRYEFRAEYAYESTKLESKPVNVNVAAPQNSAEQRAADLMVSREAGMYLASGRDEGGEGSRRLAAVEQQYSQSHLAPYARLALAMAESQDRFDPRTKTFINSGCEKAVSELAGAVPEVADPLLAARGTAVWVRCLRRLGREDEVNRAVSTLLRSHPEAKDVGVVMQLLGPARKE